MDTFIYLAVGLLLGAVIGWFVGRSRSGNGADQGQLVEARTRLEEIQKRLDLAEAERKERAERDKQENEFLRSLEPVKENLRLMREKVEEIEKDRVKEHTELSDQLKRSIENDENLRKQTEMLSSALSSNQVRGTWGEAQLRKLVELAGLVKHVDFIEQLSNETGRADMVITLPGNKSIVIDSKVPYTAYQEASKISELASGDDADRRKALLKEHVKAVKKHIDDLSTKKYWEGLTAAPDFVVCFVPSESILSAALNEDASLLEYAFSKNVAIASPVSLFSVLKTINYIWRQSVNEDQIRNLLKLGQELYARVETLGEKAQKLSDALKSNVKAFNEFIGSFETRMLVTARKLNNFDENELSTREIEPVKVVDEPVREITAPELASGLDEITGEIVDEDE